MTVNVKKTELVIKVCDSVSPLSISVNGDSIREYTLAYGSARMHYKQPMACDAQLPAHSYIQ